MFKKISMIASLMAFTFILSSCGPTLDVEYPVFPNTKEGRQLKAFIGTKKNVALVVEPPKKGLWSQIFEDSSFIDQMPAKIFAAMDKEGYYKLIDVSKTPALMNEIAFSLSGLTAKRLQIGKQLQSDMFLYIGYQKPATTCGNEKVLDKAAAAMAATMAIYNATSSNSKSSSSSSNVEFMKETGYRDLLIPLDATLIVTETGQTMKEVVSKPFRKYNSVGTLGCPSVLQSYGEALDAAAQTIITRLSPKVKTAKIKIVTKDEDPDVADFLKEGYMEASGETPSMERAMQQWKKAESKSKGKSEGALGNLGAYYFSIGDFDNAIKYFEKAMAVKGGNREYYREMRKRVEAAAATNEKEE